MCMRDSKGASLAEGVCTMGSKKRLGEGKGVSGV